MKSIVLCERTLVHESGEFTNLKNEKGDEGNNETTNGKNELNGTSKSKKSESVINTSSDESNESSEPFCKEKCGKNEGAEGGETFGESENGKSECSAASGSDGSAAKARYDLCNDEGEKDCLVVSIEDEVEEGSAENSSNRVQDVDLNRERNFSDAEVDLCDERSGNGKNGLGENVQREKSVGNSANGVSEKTFAADSTGDKEDNEESVVNIDIDVDENKENEKEEKGEEIGKFSTDDSIGKQSSACEIQVGDVQTITGSEKDSMWTANDLKGSTPDLMKIAEDDVTAGCQDDFSPNDGMAEDEKENHKLEMNGNVISESDEGIEESMHIEEEEEEGEEEEEEVQIGEEGSERMQELVNEEDRNDVKEVEVFENKDCADRKDKSGESMARRKRHLVDSDSTGSSARKKRRSKDTEEEIQVEIEHERMENSSRREGSNSPDTVVSSKDQTSSAGGVTSKKTSVDDKRREKLESSGEKEELKPEPTFSVLEKFRGSLKTLTRSDLEELIVQKLCEVITERSNVGELRRKAQALEQDQERWKTKVQSLTKQMREMEMVMKKYMTEVQKQVKEGDTHVVTPLKVTRSVGLQVSFYSSANKGPKPGLPQPATPPSPTRMVSTRNPKGTPPKLPLQYIPANQNMQNKPNSFQKNSPTVQKPAVSQQKRPIVPPISPQANRTMPKSLLNNTRGVQNQTTRTTYKSVPGSTTTTTVTTTSASAVQNQQQLQNGSKVIDLTDDDDRQTGNVVKPPGPIRVVNHLSQAPGSQGNRYAYLLPTTNASSTASGGQSRQVLIATPTMPQASRQIMCSMPPLLFKGGNVVQSGSQSHVINQSNKVLLPKVLRHPAPLPQQPVNQNNRPNLKLLPPRPALKISKVQTGIVLSWNMSLSPEHAPIASYQLYAYQESNCPPATSLWKKVGDVKALPLPMACTLTQFMSGHKYHFAVRAVDLHSRIGPFSFPGTIVLVK